MFNALGRLRFGRVDRPEGCILLTSVWLRERSYYWSVILHIAGVPAAGKSSFGRWLKEKRKFLHVDIEAPGVLNRLQLESAWFELLQRNSASLFVAKLRQLAPDAVLDWGFPPACLPQVMLLQKESVETWWFNAERNIARTKFIERGTVSTEAFDIQMDSIAKHWKEIHAGFSPRILETLLEDQGHLKPEEIWTEIERIRGSFQQVGGA